MKQIGLLVLTILISFMQAQAQTKKDKPEMAFDKTIDGVTGHDYGSIVFGANGKVDFTFTNQGTTPLIITDVKSSCGCTIPSWTKEPVAPGQRGNIKIEYNTSLPGMFNKTVVVYSNANNSPVRIEIRGKVNAKAGDLKMSQPEIEKQREIERKLEESYGKVIPTGDTVTKLAGTEAAESKKALQKAAYQERIQKEKSKTSTPGKKVTGDKKTAATDSKKASEPTARKK